MGETEMINRNDQNGVSLIAAVFIIVVLAFMGVMFVSLINTGGFTAVHDMQSTQALFIAEGGIQYTLGLNRNNIPNYSTNGIWTNLGEGQFKVDTPAYLTANIAAGAGVITVDSTASFPSAGRITIGSDFGIAYTGTDATHFTGVSGGQAHSQFNSVYPATQLASAIASDPSCTPLPNINVVESTGGFDIPGVIFIDTEYFYCTGTGVGPIRFTGCKRCYANSAPAAHPSTRFASQYALTSTGRVPSISGNAERVVRINAGPDDH
jgi:hypothetical protein